MSIAIPGDKRSYSELAFSQVNNSPLVLFRILFGLIMALECLGAVGSGWVKEMYIDIPYRITFIGFEWLNNLHGTPMYAYYYTMMGLSLLIAAGFLYRPATLVMAIMWTATYMGQKTHYNNHYYLMVLLVWLMCFVPANRRMAVDAQLGIAPRTNTCSYWCIFLFQFQVACVYIFASLAKINADWLLAKPLKLWMSHLYVPVLWRVLRQPWFPWLLAYAGILFDLLVVPALLWKPTRKWALALSFAFHLFNGIVFRIGTFPFLALGLNTFFFPGQSFDRIIRPVKKVSAIKITGPTFKRVLLSTMLIYILFQVLMPVRHHFIDGDVNWTEEGHRMAWRMMLRTKSGRAIFTVKDKNSKMVWHINPEDEMPRDHASEVASHPDMSWQFAQYLKKKYAQQGYDVQVYAVNMVKLNGRQEQLLIERNADLAHTKWNYFGHNDWIMPYHSD